MSCFSGDCRLKSTLCGFAEFLQAVLLFAIRLYFGYAFLVVGLGKFTTIENVASFFEKLGIPLSLWNAYLVAGVETIGGLLLILGLWSRQAAAILAVVMVVAFYTAHFEAISNLFSNPAGFVEEAPFKFLLAMLFIFAFGPGRISLDYLFGKLTAHKEQ